MDMRKSLLIVTFISILVSPSISQESRSERRVFNLP
jgi:hypothetical protein